MAPTNEVPEARIVSTDARIRKLLSREDAVIIPAYACRLDGFVNDTFTEYTNSSVFRPSSVCRARLVSTLQDTVRASGGYYLGFTMYASVAHDETVDIWIGHRCVARARMADPDNRVHLFVAPERFRFRGGEPIRLVTSASDGPCRIEDIVLLPRRPLATRPELKIVSPHVDVRHAAENLVAHLTWIANRPASGQLRWGQGRSLTGTVRIPDALTNHEATLHGLERNRTYRYEIRLKDRTGKLETVCDGHFKTDLPLPAGRVRKARMPLVLRRPASKPGPWPVSVGIPFPKGALADAGHIRLLGKGRTELPLQAGELARWEDGTVRWALLDFLPEGEDDYAIEYGREVRPGPPEAPLSIEESAAAISVTTGPIRVEFPTKGYRLPGVVSIRQPDGGYRRVSPRGSSPAVTLIDESGTRYTAAKPDAVVLEESGPNRACIRVDLTHRAGWGRSLFRSTFRVHLFRNSSAIRIQHTFENDRTEEDFTNIRELSLRADFDVGGDPVGHLGRRRLTAGDGQPFSLVQTHDNFYVLKRGRRTLGRGRHSEGELHLSGSAAGVSLAVRDFWQNYPKGIAFDRKGITLQICPPLTGNAYPRGGELEDRLYYYLLGNRYKLRRGISRTTEFWFHLRPAEAALPSGFGANVQAPPLYSVSLAAFNKSRTVTLLPSKDPSPFAPYEEWVEGARKAYGQDRDTSRAYGMLNFGDWFGERRYNWGNMEYDAPWCFLQEYLRGGNPDFFTWAEEAVGHLVDVDTCHHSPNPEEVGAQYLHCVGHVGNYYPDGYRETAIFTGRSSVSHTWVEGPFLYHLLSGDRRVLDAAMKTSDGLVGEVLNHYDFTNCRNCGWHLIHLSAAYRATGRRVYLNAARIIVDRVLERQRDSGGWNRLMVPGHCHCNPPRHTGNAGFMVGILMVGLKRYHEATGERRVADAIVRAADYCIDAMWVPEKSAFRYTSCPHSSVGGGADMRILKGVAAAYRFSGKERFREILSAGVRSAMARGVPRASRGVGKSICSPMRGAPQVLVDLPKDLRSKP